MIRKIIQYQIVTALLVSIAVGGIHGCASTNRAPQLAPAGDADRIPLAFTIDDLPFVGPTPRGESVERALGRIAEVLGREGVPAAGFVVCSRLDSAPAGSLDDWLSRGLAIGNHSTSHRAVGDLSLGEWIDDVRSCRDRLAELGKAPPRYFRYPFLRTGSERTARDATARALQDLGHVRAPVSIDTSEWVLARPYAQATIEGDEVRATAIADAYLQHLQLAARHYRRVARTRVGREVRQVLLLHANALLADHIERVITMLRTEGFQFVALEYALEDPIYRQEDHWVDPVGASWLYRVAPVDREGWAWDRGQQRALEARFGLRPDEPTRIGRALSARPLDDAPAWIITQKEPISANSLVFLTSDGSPILADTPWTPAATRELLDWVALRFGRLPALATVSHFHFDAAGGIGALLEAGVRVVMSTETARLLAERGPSMQVALAEEYGLDFEGWVTPEQTETFRPEDGRSERIGGTDLRVIFVGAAHSPDNIVTWFPESGVLFGGCMVKGGDSLGYLGDADLETYPAAVQALQRLDPRIVVPGHGIRTDAEQLGNTLRLLELEQRDASE